MNAVIFLVFRIIIILSLFAFLFWAFGVLWLDLRFQAKRLNKVKAPPISLIRRFGEDCQTARFTSFDVVLGRDPSCDWQVQEHSLSARHAKLSYHHGQWWIEDLNSSNGTYLNEEPVTTDMVVTNHDQLRCGNILFDIELS
jgi:hypothetical protein